MAFCRSTRIGGLRCKGKDATYFAHGPACAKSSLETGMADIPKEPCSDREFFRWASIASSCLSSNTSAATGPIWTEDELREAVQGGRQVCRRGTGLPD